MSRREVAEVFVDHTRGHISAGELVFCDTGPWLDVWSYAGATLDPEQARALGQALTAWADRKKAGGERG